MTVVDVASRYKEAEPLTTKKAAEVAEAFIKIYTRSPLTFSKTLQVDPGTEFQKDVKRLFAQNGVEIRVGSVKVHRDQGICERFNRTLAEKLFSYHYAVQLQNPSEMTTEWVKRLPAVIRTMNNEETSLTGRKPSEAIRETFVFAENSVKIRNRPVGFKEKNNSFNRSCTILIFAGGA